MPDLTLHEIVRMCEFGELDPLLDVYSAATPEHALKNGLRVARIGSAGAVVCEKVGWALFNRVLGFGLEEPATEAMLDEIAAIYEPTGNPYAIQLASTARPAELPQWLEARSFTLRDQWVKLYRGVEPPPQVGTDLRIERIGPEHAEAFGRLLSAGFGMPESLMPWIITVVGRPGWHQYLAFDGDTSVGTGTLYAASDGIGWLGIATTIPSHRRRGAQSAILAARIRDAAQLGCNYLVIETAEETPNHPNPSLHNIRRMGFKEVYLRPNYVFKPEA